MQRAEDGVADRTESSLKPDALYTADGGDFTQDEAVYRRGVEAALRAPAPVAGKPYSEVVGYVQTHCPDVYDHEAFRRGYARGQGERALTASKAS